MYVTEECSISTFPETRFFLANTTTVMPKVETKSKSCVCFAYQTSLLPASDSVEGGGDLIKCRG